MLDALKFVQGSIAKKDFVLELTHFQIKNNRVSGFNGTLSLSSPIPFDISCVPKAEPLIKAIAGCEDTVQLSMTKAGKLTVKSGPFKMHVECLEETSCLMAPEGDVVQFDGEAFLAGIKTVAPFMGQDASRRWAQGILVKDGCLFATNNIVLVQYWLGVSFPHQINIPMPAVKEILRIKEAPLYAQASENSITLHYSGERWLRTQLYSTAEWPDLSLHLGRVCNPTPIDTRLFEGLNVVKPFVDHLGSIHFQGGVITTHTEENEGASYVVPDLQDDGLYSLGMLQLLEGVATHVDWSLYPAPAMFTGDKLRGAIVGMRK